MNFLRSIVAIFFLVETLTAERLSCSVINLYTVPTDPDTNGIFLNGTVHVVYEREELDLYKYDNTNYANFLLNDVKILFDGKVLDDYKNDVDPVTVKTDLEGLGYLKRVENETYRLTNCVYDLKKNVNVSSNLSKSVLYGLAGVAHTCVHAELCQKLGNTTYDDFYRGSVMNHNFGENSAQYTALAEKYPNLNLPDPKDKSHSGLQATMNLFADFWLASVVKQALDFDDGSIVLPNVTEALPGSKYITGGYFHLIDGTVGDLTKFTRNHNINVTNEALEFIIEAEYLLPQATVHYNEYSFKAGLATADGQLDIFIKDLYFKIRISLNYNQEPCRVTATEIKSNISGIQFQLTKGNILDKLFNEFAGRLINNYAVLIVNFIENKIINIINEPLEKIDCEIYRP